jgi:hypothetical protein
MRVNLTCRDQNSQVVEDWRKSVPQGPGESSPVRSAGKLCKKTRPSRKRTIETFGFESRVRRTDFQHSSIVPSGTDRSLKTLTQHFVLGYFRRVPAGLIFTGQF